MLQALVPRLVTTPICIKQHHQTRRRFHLKGGLTRSNIIKDSTRQAGTWSFVQLLGKFEHGREMSPSCCCVPHYLIPCVGGYQRSALGLCTRVLDSQPAGNTTPRPRPLSPVIYDNESKQEWTWQNEGSNVPFLRIDKLLYYYIAEKYAHNTKTYGVLRNGSTHLEGVLCTIWRQGLVKIFGCFKTDLVTTPGICGEFHPDLHDVRILHLKWSGLWLMRTLLVVRFTGVR